VELSDVVLALVGIISAITGGVVKSLVADLKAVEKQIASLPKEYVMKSEYHDDIKEIKHLIEKLFDKVNER
jgi:cell division protein FtsB